MKTVNVTRASVSNVDQPSSYEYEYFFLIVGLRYVANVET